MQRITIRNRPKQSVKIQSHLIAPPDDEIIIAKIITENGFYNAKDENAKAYNPVRVEVPTFEEENAELTVENEQLKADIIVKNEQINNLEQDVEEAFDRGKQTEYDEFWENALLSTSAIARFAGNSWNDKTFNPPYPIYLNGNCNYLFYVNNCTTLLGKVEKIAPTNAMYMFQFSKIQHITVIDLSNLGAGTALLTSAFSSNKIVTIALLISSATIMWRNDTFQNATALENVIFEGVIGQNGLNLQWSTKLSKASITSIINCLSTTTSGLTVTLSKVAVNKAFGTSEGANDGTTSAEWTTLIGTRSNWTISLL